ncbi:MAG: membrane protein insertion efficiency factor YidD [Patescibacteria group bacterium]
MQLLNIPKRAGQLLIIAYQRTFSPDHGWIKRFFGHPVCRYTLTCSEYGHEALEKYGLMKGSWMAFNRILRCTPWHSGGDDPVP